MHKLLFVFSLSFFLTACADFYEEGDDYYGSSDGAFIFGSMIVDEDD